MAIKTTFAALVLSVAASTMAFAQTAPAPANPLRPTTPAAPAAPAQPAAPRAATPAAPATTQPAAQRPAANQLVNLNTAPAAELDKLPQIGDARAQAIIAKRPYKDWADFVAKNVVPANAEAAIKDKVRFR
ncbi:MAG: ComEA family DNA-binding protein [Beijerinckiaceae bacterium]